MLGTGRLSKGANLMENEVAHRLVQVLTEKKLTIGFAESLTGGLLADALISVPGASAVMRGSLVTYATDTKTSVLQVDPALIAVNSVIDPLVATQMATGALAALNCDIAISTTGVAGPTCQDGHPVGEVYIGFAQLPPLDLFDERETLALSLGVLAKVDPENCRSNIRRATVRAALALVLERLDPQDAPPSHDA